MQQYIPYKMKRPEAIKAEPQDYKSLVIAMINRIDLLAPNVLSSPKYFEWVGIRTKLGILNAQVVNQCGDEYRLKAEEFKAKFLNLKKKWDAYEFLTIVEDWLEEIAKHYDVLRIIPAKEIEVDMY